MTQAAQQEQSTAEPAVAPDAHLDEPAPGHVMAREHYERLAREAALDAAAHRK